MSRILYLDASSGVSGDMFVGALIAVGADFDTIKTHIGSLNLAGFDVRVRQVSKKGIMGTKFEVVDTDTGCDVDALEHPTLSTVCDDSDRFPIPGDAGHGHNHSHDNGHVQSHDHEHSHDHADTHSHGLGDHGHHRPLAMKRQQRGLREIGKIICQGGLPGPVAETAMAVFKIIAAAEARVHEVDIEQVHFHEVGALDCIVDIVSAASAFHQLGIDEAWCSPIHVGSGTVRCAHGVLPVPAPATVEILKGIPIYSTDVKGELATPTGAALVRHFCTRFAPMPGMIVEHFGCGAGSRDLSIPNVLRATVGRIPSSMARNL